MAVLLFGCWESEWEETFFFWSLHVVGKKKKKSLFSQSVENKLCLCFVIEKVNAKREKKIGLWMLWKKIQTSIL